MLILLAFSLKLLEILIFARCIISWVPGWQRQPAGQLVIVVTDPILQPLRNAIRINGSNSYLDFSPMIALFIIQAVRSIIRF